MKSRTIQTGALLLAGAILGLNGCGGSSKLNQVLDTVTPSSAVVIAGTTEVFTSTVTGSTNIDSSWTCEYSYLPANATSTTKPTTGTCTSGMSLNGGNVGTWTTNQTTSNSTLSYTAPTLSNFPNPIPILTFTATAAADTKKTGKATVALDSGIRVSVTPTTATVPVGITPAQVAAFTASLANTPPTTLNWAVEQPPVGSSNSQTDLCNNFPALFTGGACGLASPLAKSCSPSCGSIAGQTGSAVGVFTAPSSLPTKTSPLSSGTNDASAALTVTVVVWATGDTSHYAIANVTLVNASTNPVTFSGIHPTTVAAGGALQDIWLDAKNILNTTTISFTDPNGQLTNIDPSEIFTIPVTKNYCTPSASGVTPVVTCDASVLTRIRLNAAQLSVAGTGQVTVQGIPGTPSVGPGCTGTATPGSSTTDISCPLQLVYASPVIVAAVPDSYPQGTAATFAADGGYFGASTNPLVELLFNENLNIASFVGPRQISGSLLGSQVDTPGLYPVSVAFTAQTSPTLPAPPKTHATTNVAVQPTFTTAPTPTSIPLSSSNTNLAPSSIALESTKGYAIITEQANNSIQIVDLTGTGSNGRAVPSVGAAIPVGSQPTSVAIDDQINLANYPGQDLAAVVNSGDSTLSLLAVSRTSATPITTVSLSGLIQQPSGNTTPAPYAVGIDPRTHYAVVAFSNATIGFIVDVNPNSHSQTCFTTSASQTPPCVIASVSLNTGATPQVVMQPDAPLAYVTPGGAGVTSVVNLLLTNNLVSIPSGGAVRTNNVVTITTSVPNGLNQSSPGAVLIAGVTPADFNGTYNVTSATTYTFTYSQSGANETGGGGTVTFGNPYYTFSTTPTAVGGAINPVTRTFAFADPGATTSAPQIAFIHQLDQTVTSLFLTVGSCFNGCTPAPSGAPEIGMRYVAWDPYTNVLIAYNPTENYNNISLINPGGSTAGGSQSPYRIVQAINTTQTGTGSYTPSGASTPVTVYGPMTYDPKTNLVLVANAGSNNLTYMDLNPQATFKKISIREVQVTHGGVPNAQPPLATSGSTAPVAICDPTAPTNPYATCLPNGVLVGQSTAATVRILGQGFTSNGAPVARLDRDSTGITVSSASDTEVDVNIDPSRLITPHDFALDVVSGGATGSSCANCSNSIEIFAVQVTPLAGCSGSVTGAQPEGVAYDSIRNVAVVTHYGCNTVSIINLDSANAHNYGVSYGSVLGTVSVGKNPVGVDVIPRLGYAVVTNNGDGTASVIDMHDPTAPTQIAFPSNSSCNGSSTTNVCVGVSPAGVAIDQDRALAIVANSGGNSISAVDLSPLQLSTANPSGDPCSTLPCAPMQLVATSGPPKAVAIDPDRAIAVVSNTQNTGTTSVTGGLDVISLASTPPVRSTTASISSLTANPTGIVYDPVPSTPLLYVTSTQQNAVYAYNPSTGTALQIRVGVNPYSVAYNYQSGTLLSINSTSNTISVIDAANAPVFATRETLGISSQSQFAATIDNFTNTAIMVDQNNNRVVIFALPK